MPNKKGVCVCGGGVGVEINGKGGEGGLKIKSRAEEILFDTSKQNTKKLKCFELKWSAKHIKFIGKIKQQFNKNINKHSITSAKWGQ